MAPTDAHLTNPRFAERVRLLDEAGLLLDADVVLGAAGFDDAPVEVEGDRDDPESALAALLTALETLGLITDATQETTP